MRYGDLFRELAKPFKESEVKTRNQGGRHLSYITARTAMNRLDEVFGPAEWWDRFIPGEKSVLCELTVRLPDGSTLTKSDAGGYAGMASEEDDEKSGYSDAFKRAAVKFGVGRYLYGDGVPRYTSEGYPPPGKGEAYEGDLPQPPPQRPAPERDRQRQTYQEAQAQKTQSQPQTNGRNGSGSNEGPPRTGKAMFAWTKSMEQRHEVALLKYLNNWAKLQEFPGRMVDWDGDQVALAHAEALRKLSKHQSSSAYEEAMGN